MPAPPADAPRPWHQWYAQAAGFFWLPCPLCGSYFGGHEWRDVDGRPSSIPDPDSDDPRMAVGICPACTKAGLGVDPMLALETEVAIEAS